MRIAVLAASGGTGHQFAAQAPHRDHSVLALARDPRKANRPVLMPARVTRATVAAAAMLDAEKSQHPWRDRDPAALNASAGDSPT
jgi:putative NADH-flavin reductase